MNSVPQNEAENPEREAQEHNGAKREIRTTTNEQFFYRDPAQFPSSDSDCEPSCLQDSVCNDFDCQVSSDDRRRRNCKHNHRDEIAEQLSKLRIGYTDEKNGKCNSPVLIDLTLSPDDTKQHSIIAGNSPADAYRNTVPSLTGSLLSQLSIVGGRLLNTDSIDISNEEQSLLNIAINESIETSCVNLSNNRETSPFVDSLEERSAQLTPYNINETDSLETEVCCEKNHPKVPQKKKFPRTNNENFKPNFKKSKSPSKPKIISVETVHLPLDKLWLPSANQESQFPDSVLKDRNDNIKQNLNFSDQTTNHYGGSINNSEIQLLADIKTPNVEPMLFIKDRSKSSPMIGVKANTFSSELISNISNLSALRNENIEREEDKIQSHRCREKIVRRLSQQFVEAPLTFTEKLVTLLEQSLQVHDKLENTETSGANISRLTEEVRKICQDFGPQIEDQSVCPDLYFTISDAPKKRFSKNGNSAIEVTPASPLKNFGRLGGGKKVYRTTPRRVYHTNNGTQCSTPNCVNALHKVRRNNLDSPNFSSPNKVTIQLDNTANFEFWENLCYELSPNKYTRSEVLKPEASGIITHEDLIRKSDQQMASLDECNRISDSHGTNSTTTSKDCQDHSNSTRQNFIDDLSNQKINDAKYTEIERILAARIVEKRLKCFEEAEKSIAMNKNIQSVENTESSNKQTPFFNTLSACLDYLDDARTLHNYRNSLACISECSEDLESSKQCTDSSVPIEYVEAFILPAQNRVKLQVEIPEDLKSQSTPNKSKHVAETCLYLLGTPVALPESSKGTPRRSRSRSISPGANSPSVVVNKIKSPVLKQRRKTCRTSKPAAHWYVPQTPSVSPRNNVTKGKRNLGKESEMKSTPSFKSNYGLKFETGSPCLTDVTNISKSFNVPKLVITNLSPSTASDRTHSGLNITDENGQMKDNYSETEQCGVKKTKYFYTPGKTPTSKVRPTKRFFGTPKLTPLKNKLPVTSPGSYRVNYNTVQSPVAMYIRGTDPNLIKNVKGKTNERMLTPVGKTPTSKSKVSSPILAGSPCLSPKSTETSRLKFLLTPAKQIKQQQESNILNMALCESNPSSSIGSESSSNSPFPKIFYKPAPCLKMVKDELSHKCYPKVLAQGVGEKIIYRHEGRVKSATEVRTTENFRAAENQKNNLSPDSEDDVSVLHQRAATKSNYLLK